MMKIPQAPLVITLVGLALSGCVTAESPSAAKPAATPKPGQVLPEVSLKADRKQFDDLRQEIPEEIKKDNDESSAIAQLFAGGETQPERIRERFEKMLRKSRDKMDQILRKKREVYSNTERKEREAFLKNLSNERNQFSSRRNIPSEERREFFAEQDRKRSEFFGNERDKRKDFESDVTDQRKTFDDYAREKRGQFEQQYREYRQAYEERQKAEKLKTETMKRSLKVGPGGRNTGPVFPRATPADVVDPDLQEFQNIPNAPGVKLGPSDDGK